MAQGTQTRALDQPRGAGRAVRWEGGSSGRGHRRLIETKAVL